MLLFFLWVCMLWLRVEIWGNRCWVKLDGIWKLTIESEKKKKGPSQIKIVAIITKVVGQFNCAYSGFIVENIKTFVWHLTSILNYLNINPGKDLETSRPEILQAEFEKKGNFPSRKFEREGKSFVY